MIFHAYLPGIPETDNDLLRGLRANSTLARLAAVQAKWRELAAWHARAKRFAMPTEGSFSIVITSAGAPRQRDVACYSIVAKAIVDGVTNGRDHNVVSLSYARLDVLRDVFDLPAVERLPSAYVFVAIEDRGVL